MYRGKSKLMSMKIQGPDGEVIVEVIGDINEVILTDFIGRNGLLLPAMMEDEDTGQMISAPLAFLKWLGWALQRPKHPDEYTN